MPLCAGYQGADHFQSHRGPSDRKRPERRLADYQIRQLTLGSVATESRVPLAGAVFGVYTDPDCKTLAKDSNGNDARVTTRVSGNEPDTPAITLDPGTYYVQEISAPSGYQRDDTIHTVVIEQKKTFELTADNLVDRQGQLKIEKQSNKTGDIDLSGRRVRGVRR